jgi:hypothetical protein
LTAHSIRIGDRTGIRLLARRPQNSKGHTLIKTETSKRPTHRVYAVTKNGDKSFWTEIGAGWSHQDGKGFNVKLD